MEALFPSSRDTSSRTLHPSGVAVVTTPVARLHAGDKEEELSLDESLLSATHSDAATDLAVGRPSWVTISWTLDRDLPAGLLAEQV